MQKNLKKGQPLEKKKKKKIERGCHFGKKRIFWRINTQEKDEELCDFEDDESKRESKEYAGIRERKNSFSGSCPFVARFFRFVGIYSLSSS